MRLTLLTLLLVVLVGTIGFTEPVIKIEVRENATLNPELVHQWSDAVRNELASRPAEFAVVRAGAGADVVLVVKSALVDTRTDDHVRVWHIRGYFETHDGYAGPLAKSYEEPNTTAVIKHYVDGLAGDIELARRLHQRLPEDLRK